MTPSIPPAAVYGFAAVGVLTVAYFGLTRLLTLLAIAPVGPGGRGPTVPDSESAGFVERYRIAARRWRLLDAYADEFQARTGKGPGLSPMLAAYGRACEDGLMEATEDGGLEWTWPQEGGDGE